MCSFCYRCGNITGWCANPVKAVTPGMAGATGKPEMCGMSHPSEAFPHLYEKPGKDGKLKKDKAINLDDSDDESAEEEDAGEEEAEEEEPVSSSEEEDPGPEEAESSSSSSSSSDDDDAQEGEVKEEDDVKKEESSDDELKVKEEVDFG